LVGPDEPLGGQAEGQLLAAAPAARVAVLVLLGGVEQALVAQALEDGRIRLADALARERAEAVDVDAGLVDRRDDGDPERLGELVVLGAAARRDVDDPGPLLLADVLPGDDRVLDALLGLKLLEGAPEAQADKLRAAQPPDLLVRSFEEAGGAGREIVGVVA